MSWFKKLITGPEEDAAEKERLLPRSERPSLPNRQEKLPPFWVCRCFYLCIGDYWFRSDSDLTERNDEQSTQDSKLSKKRIPLKIRMIDCFVVYLFWSSGSYRPCRGRFNRKMWNLYHSLAYVRPTEVSYTVPRRTKLNCEYFDVDIDSQLTPSLKLHARVFRPKFINRDRPSKICLFLHGGGMVVGDSRVMMIHDVAARFAMKSNMIVVSGDYRLAPEHKFPKAVFDCYDFLLWIASRPIELRYHDRFLDFSNITLLGDSSGGNLGLALATLLRDNLGPDLRYRIAPVNIEHLVMCYPMTFLERYVQHPKAEKPINQPLLPRPVLDFFGEAYVEGDCREAAQRLAREDRRICPSLAGLHDLPHTVLVSAELDCLHREHLVLLEQLIEGCTEVDYHYFEMQPHGFVNFLPWFCKESDIALDRIVEDIRRIDMEREASSLGRLSSSDITSTVRDEDLL